MAGYAVNTSGTITFQDLEGSEPEAVSVLKIVDTGIAEPDYPAAQTIGSGTVYGVIYDPSNSSPICQRVVQ